MKEKPTQPTANETLDPSIEESVRAAQEIVNGSDNGDELKVYLPGYVIAEPDAEAEQQDPVAADILREINRRIREHEEYSELCSAIASQHSSPHEDPGRHYRLGYQIRADIFDRQLRLQVCEWAEKCAAVFQQSDEELNNMLQARIEHAAIDEGKYRDMSYGDALQDARLDLLQKGLDQMRGESPLWNFVWDEVAVNGGPHQPTEGQPSIREVMNRASSAFERVMTAYAVGATARPAEQ